MCFRPFVLSCALLYLWSRNTSSAVKAITFLVFKYHVTQFPAWAIRCFLAYCSSFLRFLLPEWKSSNYPSQYVLWGHISASSCNKFLQICVSSFPTPWDQQNLCKRVDSKATRAGWGDQPQPWMVRTDPSQFQWTPPWSKGSCKRDGAAKRKWCLSPISLWCLAGLEESRGTGILSLAGWAENVHSLIISPGPWWIYWNRQGNFLKSPGNKCGRLVTRKLLDKWNWIETRACLFKYRWKWPRTEAEERV